ncbi:hypothetical protein [Arthrobacter sp. EpRS71]|uniref:hypothetical protein n=1 Tax=Arthrobacter sp. EpRS71 TaxID=1743141 RepID=UPI000749D10D|nr:hypothetical protein [Arthrobacter sp. EpRS71]KUM36046.1 hypothetical protein AR689_18990 [Arthrobacter sp. EpRS71]
MSSEELSVALNPDNLKYRVTNVLLDEMSVETNTFDLPRTKRVRFQFSGSNAEGYPLLRLTSTTVELLDSDDEAAVTLKCTYKVNFSVSESDDLQDIDDELRVAAARISYPYHRQFISEMTGRLGLRPTFLPAVPDDLWLRDSESQSAD